MSGKFKVGDRVWVNIANLTKSMVEYEETPAKIVGEVSLFGRYMDVDYLTVTYKYEVVDDDGKTHRVLERNIFNTKEEAINAQ